MLKQDIPILTSQQIREVVDCHEKILTVPEWGGAVKLRAWTLEQRDQFVAMVTDNGRPDGTPDAKKFTHCCVLFGVVEPVLTEEILASKSYSVVDRIATEILKLNGMNKEAGLTASATFRPDTGTPLSVSVGQGSQDGQFAATAQ